MRLYHGTSSRHLDTILQQGIVPRGDTPSNWPAASSSERVYLTNAYAMYFAQSSRKDRSEDLLVVEIETDLLPDATRLQADEDSAWFIWSQGSMPRQFCPPFTMTDKYEQAMHFSGILDDLAEYGMDHEMSLELLGNCSHLGTIPPSAITKVLRYSAAEGPWWVMFHDPVISPLNFKFNGSEYRATQLVVADRLEEARHVEQLIPGFLDLDAVERMCASRRTEIQLPACSPVVAMHAP
ncbi:hypothetical protein OIU34_16590 [Pararhizobium sp. BT-229]|uniref:hypothetical protein n=1 Tax=Pararhizobium sp. BT-229 TaxID=2986923 RepID=UPI0021F6FB45|nr:hypothetical protein [Pararhizobium sp. BT-229]MCV9963522.1 hypothetical protein [Pararhizobium sp. BT-229]